LRVEAGKKECIILDHVASCYRFGLPDDVRSWSLDSSERRKRKAGEAGPALRSCTECFATFHAGLDACPCCGHIYVTKGREPEQIDGQLVELDPSRRPAMGVRTTHEQAVEKRKRGYMMKMAKTLEDWVRLALKWDYKPAWAAVRWAARVPGRKTDFAGANRIARQLREEAQADAGLQKYLDELMKIELEQGPERVVEEVKKRLGP
jgi:hypothetical protein